MFYIIQENTFKERNYDNIILSMNRLGLKYEIVKVLPFIEDVDFKTKETNIFIFGSLKLARLGKKYNWMPGSLHNENHNYEVYSKYYKENLLNWDSEILNFDDEFDLRTPKFIRPTLDTKLFTGAVFDCYEWERKKKAIKCNENSLTKDTKIQISSVKKLFNESRFWVVNGKIVTYSTYRVAGQIHQSHAMVDPDAIEFAQKMVDKFQLAEAFVIDIANTNKGYKVIEAGCINCAGFYDANLQELIINLENHFEK